MQKLYDVCYGIYVSNIYLQLQQTQSNLSIYLVNTSQIPLFLFALF